MNSIIDELNKIVRAELPEYEVKVEKVEKYGGPQTGIGLIHSGSENSREITVTAYIYLEDFQDHFTEEKLAARKMFEILKDNLNPKINPQIIEQMRDREFLKKNVLPQLVGFDGNEDYLKDKPHRKFLDLAIIYRLILEKSEKTSAVITNKILQQFGLNEEDLYKMSMENLSTHSFEVISLVEILAADGIPRDLLPDTSMRVGICRDYAFGAVMMLFPGLLSNIAEEFGNDVIILPSSIYEILLVDPKTILDKDAKGVVKQVNVEAVKPAEKLSDSAYKYDRKTGNIFIL